MITRVARVKMLIGTGHFLSHFYMLILPPFSLAPAFQVMMLMSGVTAILQIPSGSMLDGHGAWPFLVSALLLASLLCMGTARSAALGMVPVAAE